MHDGQNDPMKPRRMAGALKLYRAMSLAELHSIFESGVITGGSNVFNGFDRRPLVFFGPAMTPRLIFQGEEVDRAMSYAVFSTPEFGEIALHERKVADFLETLLPRAKRAVKALFASKPAKAEAYFGAADWSQFPDMNSHLFRDSIKLLPDVEGVRQQLRDFGRARVMIDDAIKAKLLSLIAEEKVRRNEVAYTSAVVETAPLSGGWHYSKRFGQSGMGEEDEFGFEPGLVKLEDLTCVSLLRGGTVEWEGSPDDAGNELRSLGLADTAPATGPAHR